jgi:hypothetical protein
VGTWLIVSTSRENGGLKWQFREPEALDAESNSADHGRIPLPERDSQSLWEGYHRSSEHEEVSRNYLWVLKTGDSVS